MFTYTESYFSRDQESWCGWLIGITQKGRPLGDLLCNILIQSYAFLAVN